MNSGLLRIVDANANRAREALRVLEDYARFSMNDQELTEELKQLRHDLAGALAELPMAEALLNRDTPGDVGTGVKTEAEFTRTTTADVLAANGKRLSEALRSLEESAKMLHAGAAAELERLRYRGYAVEQRLMARVMRAEARQRFGRVRLYVLLTESLCAAGRKWGDVLEEILSAAGAAGGESLCVQLREKGLEDGELLARAKVFAEKCRQAGAVSIINDRADIAQLAGADGVHVGQTDVPCNEVRKMLGPEAIVGVSTERLEQARAAAMDGATYIAVGPMFPTTTKEKPRIAGPGYAAEVLAAMERPVVAIGGITLENVGELVALGVRAVAVSAAVVKSPRPGERVREFLKAIPERAPGK